MLEGFKKFIFRGNVVDLAVGLIMGVAFGDVVKSMVADILTPVLGLIGGAPDFSGIKYDSIMVGKFINALINFAIQAAVVYFGIVLPMNKLMEPMKKDEKTPGPTKEQELLMEIRDLLKAKNS